MNPDRAISVALPMRIERTICFIRGHRVMLDSDLAALYEVETKVLNQAVRRNIHRFPPDFMFPLNRKEVEFLRSQSVTSNGADSLRSQFVTLENGKIGRGRYRKYPPLVFTEQGVAMLSSVLQSERAVQVNIAIMRAFVRLRAILLSHKDLAAKLDALERKYDVKFRAVFEAIRKLMEPPDSPTRPIGFDTSR